MIQPAAAFTPSRLHQELVSMIAAGIQKAREAKEPVLVSYVSPFPDVAPETMAKALDFIEADTHFWAEPNGARTMLGAGEAWRFEAAGEDRFAALEAEWSQFVARALVYQPEPASLSQPAGPVLLGGFAFDPLAEKGPAWQGFPDGLLRLPQLMLTATQEKAWLTFNAVVDAHSDPEVHAELLQDAARALEEALAQAALEQVVCQGAPGAVVVEGGEPAAWKAAVKDATQIIRAGALPKVVLARSVSVRLPQKIAYGRVVQALLSAYPECYGFAVRLGEQVFLGATPERLVALQDRRVWTMSLAGSIARGKDPQEDRILGETLLSDPKNLWEHQIVVDFIREGLVDACRHLEIAERPTLLKMQNVQHLWTPVEGELASSRSVLDLVRRLHPTPAVGGYPKDEALALIRRIEGLDRGWYAGPVGWVDRRGDGEFAVALRSALVSGDEALLFAGCGIVGDSDPDAEFEESSIKLKPMLYALERSLK